ncbi:DeoR/GlpR family DNA-binding transcription regulator [Streptococcus merionis]|uniref:Lactose phosphotransferase system repressor n=1 Tax=Streptococcus merionis TaxID=400065 RepID=A0A239SMC2_9STRE|nr:DeoR/GlpR family DNA-binding transcription regulator [Streptococcus merionis]SNU86382.1 sugar metabolism transcriptional regulator [Streptococcus merionis]
MNRLDEIIQLVSTYQRIDVNTLSEQLGVSKVTIRKDLDKLEEKGLLHREHGFAVRNSDDDLNLRLTIHYNIKKRIAQQAAQLVDDYETVMIESGSTCVLLAEELCKTKKNIKIITNSYFIASYLQEYDNCQIILLGGDYQKEAQVTVGPLLKEMIHLFHVDKAFVGTDGYTIESGFTSKDLMRSEVVRYMREASNELIILTDASKFSNQGTVRQFTLDQVSRIITDQSLSEEMKNHLSASNLVLELV